MHEAGYVNGVILTLKKNTFFSINSRFPIKSHPRCSLYIMFFRRFKIYIPDSSTNCVHTIAGQTLALQQKCQSSEKSQHFKEKHNF